MSYRETTVPHADSNCGTSSGSDSEHRTCSRSTPGWFRSRLWNSIPCCRGDSGYSSSIVRPADSTITGRRAPTGSSARVMTLWDCLCTDEPIPGYGLCKETTAARRISDRRSAFIDNRLPGFRPGVTYKEIAKVCLIGDQCPPHRAPPKGRLDEK